MRMRNYHGKASESDRHVPDMKPKWMVSFGPFLCDFIVFGLLITLRVGKKLSGKRGGGSTDRR